MKDMRFSLKKLNPIYAHSPRFSASVYVGSKRLGVVSNKDYGGGHSYSSAVNNWHLLDSILDAFRAGETGNPLFEMYLPAVMGVLPGQLDRQELDRYALIDALVCAERTLYSMKRLAKNGTPYLFKDDADVTIQLHPDVNAEGVVRDAYGDRVLFLSDLV